MILNPNSPTPLQPPPTQPTAQPSSRELALTIAHTADDRKGGNILVLQVGDISYLTDFFIVVTGFSKTQVRAIAQAIVAATTEQFNRPPLRTEGMEDSSWVLLDYGDAIVHVLLPREREFYNLEAFWGHAEIIDFQAET
uniref:Ribosomal silencing factor RsfS n=1 Tax=Cyanothece sp. (strain PCC 7425 / ATCC 29141) TaxID=395961 RepID=B8HKL6_CYAP4